MMDSIPPKSESLMLDFCGAKSFAEEEDDDDAVDEGDKENGAPVELSFLLRADRLILSIFFLVAEKANEGVEQMEGDP